MPHRLKGAQLRANTRVGLILGLIMATLYSAYAVALFLLQGSDPFSKQETSIQAVLLAYYAAGALGGSAVGALSPLARSWPGRTLVGIVAAVIVVFCVLTSTDGPFWLWRRSEWQALAVLSIIFGVACSFTWKQFIDR